MQVARYPTFRSIYDGLAGMGFYNFHPEQIRELQSPDPGDLLKPDGGNIARVLENLKSGSPETAERVAEYLSKVVPGTVLPHGAEDGGTQADARVSPGSAR